MTDRLTQTRPFTAASNRHHQRSQARALIAAALMAGGLTACGPSAQTQQRATEIGQTTGSATRGAEVFAATCVRCHGKAGDRIKRHDLTSADVRGKPAAELATTILQGEDDMPAFAGRLNNQQVADVLAWIRRER